MVRMTLPDRDRAHPWAQRLRQGGTVTALPSHVPYRLAALADADEARYVDVNIPDSLGPGDARIIVLTDDAIIDVRCLQIDVRVRAAAGQATTAVTMRRLSDVAQLAIGGDDLDWTPGHFDDLDPTEGSIVATLVDGTRFALLQTKSA